MNLNLFEPQEVDCTGVTIPLKEVMKRIGYPADYQEKNPIIQEMMDHELKFTRENLAPRGILRVLEIESKSDEIILFKNVPFAIRERRVAKLLKSSEKSILFMCTIGDLVEKRIQHLLEVKDITRSVILDAIASETADAVADLLHRSVVKEKAAHENLKVTARFSPGYGDWPLVVQREILKTIRGDKIGISLNGSYLMHPRKSVSAIFGLERLAE